MNGFGNGAPTNPYDQQQYQQQAQPQPLQTQFTGAGFGGYGPQPTQQQPFPTGNAFGQEQVSSPAQMQTPSQIQPQTTNPFRQSMMATGSSSGFGAFGQQQQQQPQQYQQPQRQGTNPFSRTPIQPSIPEDGPAPPQQQQQTTSPFSSQPAFQAQPLQSQVTGTNPFARNQPSQQPTPPVSPPNALQVQPTGSTNPFRQSMFMNQQTGQGWQHTQQSTMGGMENIDTVPVFPRPGQQPTQQNQSPWG